MITIQDIKPSSSKIRKRTAILGSSPIFDNPTNPLLIIMN